MSSKEWKNQDPVKELEHLALIYFERGHTARARQLLEEIARLKTMLAKNRGADHEREKQAN